eukprot:3630242-Pleurochrysis_carterae.AAC.2
MHSGLCGAHALSSFLPSFSCLAALPPILRCCSLASLTSTAFDSSTEKAHTIVQQTESCQSVCAPAASGDGASRRTDGKADRASHGARNPLPGNCCLEECQLGNEKGLNYLKRDLVSCGGRSSRPRSLSRSASTRGGTGCSRWEIARSERQITARYAQSTRR